MLWAMRAAFFVLDAALLCACGGGSRLRGNAGEDTGAEAADGQDPSLDPGAEPSTDPFVDPSGDGMDVPADETADGSNACAPQDASAHGACEMILHGVKWDGGHCVPLGSGCECMGGDCDALYDTVEECVDARRGCYRATCESQAVYADHCVGCEAAMFLGVFWNGRECFPMHGCLCGGEGCDTAFISIEECEAYQARCDATLCTATGGIWFPASYGFCGFYCGRPSDDDCEMDSCYCGTGRTFVSGTGCQDDADCTQEDLCRASRGRWYPAGDCYCGFTCGAPNDCEACVDSCDCGPQRNFNPEAGCVADAMCRGALREDICESTGGVWYVDEGTGDFDCGIPDILGTPGCDCGRFSIFNETEGCVYGHRCVLRDVNEDCWWSASNCRPGLVCCSYCGIPPGCSRCHHPCCAETPECIEGCFPPPP